jgi:uncharacterized protein YyaL (SSP411 family)
MADQGLYGEKSITDGNQPMQPAFMWGAGVQLSALAAAARSAPSAYTLPLAEYADALQKYWIVNDGIGGYGVLPDQPRSDRYYDDNAWIVLGLIETFAATSDAKYLERAEAAMQFVLSGEDDALGGGIYWRENRRRSKNTCSNAPAIVGALRLYQETFKPQYLATAVRLYDWTRLHLQDEQDGLFWDNIRLSGRLDERKYSYNSALMIRANCLFYEIKSDPKYLTEAKRIAKSAAARWIVSDTGAIKDGGRFAHLLLEAVLALGRIERDPHWLGVVQHSLAFVRTKLRDPNGRYPNRWDRPPERVQRSFMLIDQASAARAYFVVANAMRQDQRPDALDAATKGDQSQRSQ